MQISDNDSIAQHSLFVTHEFHTALVKNGTWNLNVVQKSTQISRILSIFNVYVTDCPAKQIYSIYVM